MDMHMKLIVHLVVGQLDIHVNNIILAYLDKLSILQ